jgi:hypothetical protein
VERTADPSASLGMTKGGVVLPQGIGWWMGKLYAKRETSRSFHPHHNCEGKNKPKLCHPERTPDFLLRCTNQRPRMRLSLRKAARGLPTPLSLTGNPEEAEGSAVLSTSSESGAWGTGPILMPVPVLFAGATKFLF